MTLDRHIARSMQSAWLRKCLLALMFLVAWAFYNSIQLHHDVAWYVYCNLRQLEGMRPYIDIIEVSPPIAFYLTLLPVAVSVLTGLSVKLCVVTYVLALTALSLWLALSFDTAAGPSERQWKAIGIAAVLLIVPIAVFAQREHFAVLLGLPYFFAAAARREGRSIAWWPALVAGLTAGIGLSIKHYFLLAPFLVEAYLVVSSRSLRSLFRPEIYGALISGAAYAAFVLLVHPEYLTVSVPLILAAYEAYSLPLWLASIQPVALAMLLGSAFFLMARRFIANVPTADVLFVAGVAFVICYFWQGKGWPYHGLPANLLLSMASIELASRAISGRAVILRLSARQRWTLPLASFFLILCQTIQSGYYRNQFAEDAAPYIARYAPHGRIFMMSSNLSTGFPLVLDTDARWSSRYATQWLLPDILRGQQLGAANSPARRQQLEWLTKTDIDTTVADFETYKPNLVFVDLTYQSRPTRIYNGISVDMIAYYNRDPRFAAIWRHYRKVATINSYLSDEERNVELWARQD
ncbi:hypothetical protein [Dongia sp.]|uniref:hypothetical protein n=1 Tax=Dongia sp. TaxID=1977262 RepID=UPI0035B30217